MVHLVIGEMHYDIYIYGAFHPKIVFFINNNNLQQSIQDSFNNNNNNKHIISKNQAST